MTFNSQLVLMNLDGTEGQSFDIQGDVLIGRDRNCNVRIKLPSISRQHARLTFDENGKVVLTHLSTTNPSFINGSRMNKIAVLSHGDLLAFGDRIFMFKQLFDQNCSENNSFDLTRKPLGVHNMPPFSPVSTNSVAKKGLPTPIRKKIESLRKVQGESPNGVKNASTPKKVNVIEEKRETRKALPTPLRQGIQQRLQNEPSTQSTLIGLVERMKTPSKKNCNQERKILPTPLRLGIQNRRNSPDISEPAIIKSALKKPRDSAELLHPPQPAKRVNFNLQEAIVARKKTLRRVGDMSIVSQQMEEEQAPAWKASMKSLVPTPLRKAVEMRRAKLDAMEAEIATQPQAQNETQSLNQISVVEDISPFFESVKRQLFTPLKNEITKRRVSARINPESPLLNEDENRIEEVERDSNFLSPVIEKVVIAINETLRSPSKEGSTATPIKALALPLRQAIQARRQSYSSTKLEGISVSGPVVKETETSKYEELTPTVAPEENPKTEDEIKTTDSEEQRHELTLATENVVKDVITSHSLQLTAEVLCANKEEEVREDVSSYHAIAETVAQVLVNPRQHTPSKRRSSLRGSASGLFSPITPNNDRQQKYVLQSLEKKSRAYYSQRFADITTDRETFLADLVGSLSDIDMEIIEAYAEKLTRIVASSVLDECDAFGVAMDAYVRGIEIALNSTESKNGGQVNEVEPRDDFCVFQADEESHESEEEADTEGEKEENDEASQRDYCLDYSVVLSRLFRLPRDFLDATSDVMDQELVESYAEELSQSAGVCSAVAYGIALDSFLADPVQFRHYVGRLALPVYTQCISSKSEDPIEEKNQLTGIIASTESFEISKSNEVEEISHVAKTPRKNRKDIDIPPSSRTLRSAKKQEVVKEEILDSTKKVMKIAVEGLVSQLFEKRETNDPVVMICDIKDNQLNALADSNIEHVKGSVRDSDVIEIPIHSLEDAEDIQIPEQVFVYAKSEVLVGEPTSTNTEQEEKDEGEHHLPTNGFDEVTSIIPEKLLEIETAGNDELQATNSVGNVVIGEKRKFSLGNAQGEIRVNEIPESSKRRKGNALDDNVTTTETPGKKRGRGKAKIEESPAATEEAETKDETKDDKATMKRRRNATEEVSDKIVSSDDIIIPKRGRAKKPIVDVAIQNTELEEEKEPAPPVRATRNTKQKEETGVKSIIQGGKAKGKGRGKGRQEEVEEEMEEALAILCDGCDDEYFVDEIGLKKIPKGKWFCEKCTVTSSKNSTSTRKKK